MEKDIPNDDENASSTSAPVEKLETSPKNDKVAKKKRGRLTTPGQSIRPKLV